MCLNLGARHLDCHKGSVFAIWIIVWGRFSYCFAFNTVPLSVIYTTCLIEKGDDGLDCRVGLVFAIWNILWWKVSYCFAFNFVNQMVLLVDVVCLALLVLGLERKELVGIIYDFIGL